MLNKKDLEIQKKLLRKGVKSLNRLTCNYSDSKLQELLYQYGMCKEDLVKLKKAIKVLNQLGTFVNYSDVQKMKSINN